MAAEAACWTAPFADAREAGRSVSDAASCGFASGLGSASRRLTSAGSTFCGFGAAYCAEIFVSSPYVYVLPYASWTWTYLPSRAFSPIRVTCTSPTATTGEPASA